MIKWEVVYGIQIQKKKDQRKKFTQTNRDKEIAVIRAFGFSLLSRWGSRSSASWRRVIGKKMVSDSSFRTFHLLKIKPPCCLDTSVRVGWWRGFVHQQGEILKMDLHFSFWGDLSCSVGEDVLTAKIKIGHTVTWGDAWNLYGDTLRVDICSESLGLHEGIPRVFTTASTDMTPVCNK